MTISLNWVAACNLGDIEDEDVFRFDHGDEVIAIYRLGDAAFATDGYCTHEHALLTDGFVIDGVIECPLHQGRFEVRSGKAIGGPVCVDLRTYPVRIDRGRVVVGLPPG
jgi:3-phenylpropionate/trans-cinnamate dioxygenase ferredoxin component